jgi:hypothetical protein
VIGFGDARQPGPRAPPNGRLARPLRRRSCRQSRSSPRSRCRYRDPRQHRPRPSSRRLPSCPSSRPTRSLLSRRPWSPSRPGTCPGPEAAARSACGRARPSARGGRSARSTHTAHERAADVENQAHPTAQWRRRSGGASRRCRRRPPCRPSWSIRTTCAIAVHCTRSSSGPAPTAPAAGGVSTLGQHCPSMDAGPPATLTGRARARPCCAVDIILMRMSDEGVRLF